jgi:hypothetical protein
MNKFYLQNLKTTEIGRLTLVSNSRIKGKATIVYYVPLIALIDNVLYKVKSITISFKIL